MLTSKHKTETKFSYTHPDTNELGVMRHFSESSLTRSKALNIEECYFSKLRQQRHCEIISITVASLHPLPTYHCAFPCSVQNRLTVLRSQPCQPQVTIVFHKHFLNTAFLTAHVYYIHKENQKEMQNLPAKLSCWTAQRTQWSTELFKSLQIIFLL